MASLSASNMYVSPTQSWPIARYARYFNASSSSTTANATESGGRGGQWKHYDNRSLVLVLLESKNMIISSGNTIYENYSLHNASACMRGVSKGDSIMFACKVQNEIRRFRVQFKKTIQKAAQEVCEDCGGVLTKFFSIKNTSSTSSVGTGESQVDPSSSSGDNEAKQMHGQVSLQDMARSMCDQSSNVLPIAYQYNNMGELPKEKMQEFIRVCLTDANFPAFVGSVEKELQQIISED
ncbi:meiotic recombination protein REC114-like [Glandiceps talaboti]